MSLSDADKVLAKADNQNFLGENLLSLNMLDKTVSASQTDSASVKRKKQVNMKAKTMVIYEIPRPIS